MRSECRKSPRVRVFRVQSETSRGARGPQTLQSYRDDERRGRGSRSCAGSDPQPHVGVARVGVARVIADAARGGRALPLAVAPRWRRAAAPLRAAELRVQTTEGTLPYQLRYHSPYRNQWRAAQRGEISIYAFFGCPLFLRGREPGGERENTPVIPGRGGLQGAATVIRDPRRPTRSLHSD